MQPKVRQVSVFRNSILKYLLVVLFISYYVGSVAFTHVHHFPTYTIIHSHPYLLGQEGQLQHTHSAEAFKTIDLLNDIVLEETPVFVLGMVWVLLTIFLLQRAYTAVLRTICGRNLRAPPALFI